MKICRLVMRLALAVAVLAIGASKAAACHVVKVALQVSGDKSAGPYEYTPDGLVRAAAASDSAQPNQRTLSLEDKNAIWSMVNSFSSYMGKVQEAPPGSAAAVDLYWDTGQKAHLAWPAAGDHADPQVQTLLQLLLKARPVSQ